MSLSRNIGFCMTLWIVFAVAGERGPDASAQTASSAAPSTTDPFAANAPLSSTTYTTRVATNTPVAAGTVPTSRFAFQPGSGRLPEPALVVPGKEVDIETVNRIVEDLMVMSRIIERNSLNAVVSPDRASLDPLFRRMRLGGRTGVGPDVLFSSVGRPRPLYVAGYGAVFFIQVDFPLLPPPETKDKPPATEQTDAVWAETKRAIFEPQTRGAMSPGDAEAPEPYSRERVDTLKSTLTAVMKHATNIRALESGERLTIVVQGTSSRTEGSTQMPPSGLVGGLTGSAPDGRSVLTLRASKADINLYAKGELSQAQFEQRLQVILY